MDIPANDQVTQTDPSGGAFQVVPSIELSQDVEISIGDLKETSVLEDSTHDIYLDATGKSLDITGIENIELDRVLSHYNVTVKIVFKEAIKLTADYQCPVGGFTKAGDSFNYLAGDELPSELKEIIAGLYPYNERLPIWQDLNLLELDYQDTSDEHLAVYF